MSAQGERGQGRLPGGSVEPKTAPGGMGQGRRRGEAAADAAATGAKDGPGVEEMDVDEMMMRWY